MEAYDIFEKHNHLQPDFDKRTFDQLHGWDFGWEMLQPINIANSSDDDKELSKRFSPGQKALYFFWYLDAAVSNGGFRKFYWDDYRHYLPTIKQGLKLIGDTALYELIELADKEYLLNETEFKKQQATGDPRYLLKNMKSFEHLDEAYFQIHDNTMQLIEAYARVHPDEFVKLK